MSSIKGARYLTRKWFKSVIYRSPPSTLLVSVSMVPRVFVNIVVSVFFLKNHKKNRVWEWRNDTIGKVLGL